MSTFMLEERQPAPAGDRKLPDRSARSQVGGVAIGVGLTQVQRRLPGPRRRSILARMDEIQSLREAVQHSPHNIPLRRHLGDTLLRRGLAGDAEQEFRDALAIAPDDVELKLGLARAFFQQGKASHALVIVEDLTKNPDAPARAYVLHAKLLASLGDIERAVREYRRGVDKDPAAGDPEFSARLGIRDEDDDDDDDDESEVVDG